jgi:predicted secreted protein
MAKTIAQNSWKLGKMRTVPEKTTFTQNGVMVLPPPRELLRFSWAFNLEDIQKLWIAGEKQSKEQENNVGLNVQEKWELTVTRLLYPPP